MSSTSASPEALARQAAEISGVPVRYAATVSPRWHSVVLECPNDAACIDALRRLAAAPSHFDVVEPDAPRRLDPPSRDDAKKL